MGTGFFRLMQTNIWKLPRPKLPSTHSTGYHEYMLTDYYLFSVNEELISIPDRLSFATDKKCPSSSSQMHSEFCFPKVERLCHQYVPSHNQSQPYHVKLVQTWCNATPPRQVATVTQQRLRSSSLGFCLCLCWQLCFDCLAFPSLPILSRSKFSSEIVFCVYSSRSYRLATGCRFATMASIVTGS